MWVRSHPPIGPSAHLGEQQDFLDVIEFEHSGISRKSPTMAGGLKVLLSCTRDLCSTCIPQKLHGARLVEGFSRGKRGDHFGWDRDRVACSWVASFTRLAVTETEAPKTTPCDVVSPVQRVHSPLQETREDCYGLVLRELDRCGHVVNERCLGHTSLSSRREPPHGARGRC